ncbi:MAG: Lrp/AsnC family transcriptional regulator [Hyphomicrobiaceae bacterium]|nr:MAG: Lrp/AsnC family transcriptional regulator [Hyphomicrobiaceae bacterium]
MIDMTDRRIINALQGGFPVGERPYAEAAKGLGLSEEELIGRLGALIDRGVLSRFGPMYNADRIGGAVCLCAMSAPAEKFEDVSARVNAHREVAHNYERAHQLNMWFVLASDSQQRLDEVVREIEEETNSKVLAFPKLAEFFVGLRIEA